jgi:hypothetical protein
MEVVIKKKRKGYNTLPKILKTLLFYTITQTILKKEVKFIENESIMDFLS